MASRAQSSVKEEPAKLLPSANKQMPAGFGTASAAICLNIASVTVL